MSNPSTYINGVCQVGQREPCGEPATHAIATVTVADTAWATETREGGIVPLCEYHAATAAQDWSA